MPFLKMIYYGLLVFSLITLLLNKRKLNKKYYWFIPLISIGIITQVAGDIVNHGLLPGHKKTFMFHIYQPLEYVILALFYWQLLQGKIIKRLVLISIPMFVSFCIYYYSTNAKAYLGPDFTHFSVEAILTGALSIRIM